MLINVRDISAITETPKGCYIAVLEEEPYLVKGTLEQLIDAFQSPMRTANSPLIVVS